MIDIYYHLFFVITLLTVLFIREQSVPIPQKNTSWPILCWLMALTAIILIAFEPIPWGTSADREYYTNEFLELQSGHYKMEIDNDPLFTLYLKFLGNITSYWGMFFVTAFIYVRNYYVTAKRLVPEQTFILFLMMLNAFMFYAYGTNTTRAGFAVSFILLGMTQQKMISQLLLLAIGVLCHFSMIIPALAFLIAKYFDKTNLYIKLWFLSILLSIFFGDYFEHFFAGFEEVDERAGRYLNIEEMDSSYNTGFRIDFILYSCVPMLLGYYYIYKRRFQDSTYKLLYNTYILANIFWILVIRANFSDRFAYLSWFLYPILLIYPLLKTPLLRNQNKRIALIILLQEAFTYFMFLR